VLIIGGFDSANMPDIGYGYQQGGLRRWASRWIMRRAGRLMTFSNYSLSEIERNTPIPPERVTVIHHGVPDPFGEEPGPKEREALTVGAIDHTTLVQKGQLPFVEASRLLPDVTFTFAGKWLDGSVDELRARAGDNEVVGDAGVLIDSQEPAAVADGVRRALELGPDAARRARERILTAFPMERRREGILRVVQDALDG
jgi:hypothetical protein